MSARGAGRGSWAGSGEETMAGDMEDSGRADESATWRRRRREGAAAAEGQLLVVTTPQRGVSMFGKSHYHSHVKDANVRVHLYLRFNITIFSLLSTLLLCPNHRSPKRTGNGRYRTRWDNPHLGHDRRDARRRRQVVQRTQNRQVWPCLQPVRVTVRSRRGRERGRRCEHVFVSANLNASSLISAHPARSCLPHPSEYSLQICMFRSIPQRGYCATWPS